ncbi:hypothetical protein CEXT_705321 [Caerostris extrusa]|uniref:Uncharacterized protein n=1 Tax=Caerostris extrusa TaxID=172846 RepID=A0AAV4WD22_CAEEX|nr:hypothetical protein CEXT_705321 [Caerostris extrusa]
MSPIKKPSNVSNTALMIKTSKYYHTSSEKFNESSISIKIAKDSKDTKKSVSTLNKSLVTENNRKSTKLLPKSPTTKQLNETKARPMPEINIKSQKMIKKGTNDRKILENPPYSSHKIQYRSEMKEKPTRNSTDSSADIGGQTSHRFKKNHKHG